MRLTQAGAISGEALFTLVTNLNGFNIDDCIFSIGRIVRAIAESDPKANTENHKIKNAIAAGEMINKQSIQKILETHLVNLSDRKGIIIDGYPRDIKQVTDFEDKVFNNIKNQIDFFILIFGLPLLSF